MHRDPKELVQIQLPRWVVYEVARLLDGLVGFYTALDLYDRLAELHKCLNTFIKEDK